MTEVYRQLRYTVSKEVREKVDELAWKQLSGYKYSDHIMHSFASDTAVLTDMDGYSSDEWAPHTYDTVELYMDDIYE